MADQVYNSFKARIMNDEVGDLATDDLRVALLDSAYTPDIDNHATWGDVSANEVTGTGYTAGGEQLSGVSVTTDDTDDEGVIDANDVTWASSTIDAAYAVVYDSTSTDNDLVAVFDFGGEKSSSSGDFKIQWNSEGLLNLG